MRIERIISRYPGREKELLDYASWSLKLGIGTLQASYNDFIEVPTQMVCRSTEELKNEVSMIKKTICMILSTYHNGQLCHQGII